MRAKPSSRGCNSSTFNSHQAGVGWAVWAQHLGCVYTCTFPHWTSQAAWRVPYCWVEELPYFYQCQQLSQVHETMTYNWQQRKGKLLGAESKETVKGDSVPPFSVFSLPHLHFKKNDLTLPLPGCFLLLLGWHECVSSSKFLWDSSILCGVVRSFSFPPSPPPAPSKHFTLLLVLSLELSDFFQVSSSCEGAGRSGRW